MQFLIKELKNTFAHVLEHWKFFLVCWLLLISLDLSNYFFHLQAGGSEENARTIEIIFQLILVYFSVCFFHGLNLQALGQKLGFFKVVGEAILLTPGFVLQSIFFALSVVVGAALLVLPGFYALFVFYFAPVVAVIYPDYQGKVFLLTRELTLEKPKKAIGIIIFTGLIPLIPEGLIWLSTGALKSKATPFIAPLDGMLFLFCEALVFRFVFELVAAHRSKSS